MTSSDPEGPGWDDPALVEDLADLMRECFARVRRQDPPEAWTDVLLHIATLEAQLNGQDAGSAQCTYCGVRRPTTTLHVFELVAPQRLWNLCDRCWRMLELGFHSLHPGLELAGYLARPFALSDVILRGYIGLGGAVVARNGTA